MRKLLLPLALLALTALTALTAGCLPKSKEWIHPRIADPRKEDKQFIEDTAFCEGKIGTQPEGPTRDAALQDCYRRLGWQRKE